MMSSGISPDGMQITNPTLFLESVLQRIPGVKGLTSAPPRFEQGANASYTGILGQTSQDNLKSYQSIPSLKLSRISASGYNNCCFFDSFLTCMSPIYRGLSLQNRQMVFVAFRNWCAVNSDKILEQAPEFVKKLIDLTSVKEEIVNLNIEIDYLTGFIIAWFFGVNCVFISKPRDRNIASKYTWSIVCESSYQSPDCKTIFMINTLPLTAGAAGHYEPLGTLSLNEADQLDESKSKFLFDWTDRDLCKIKTICNEICKPTDFLPEIGDWKLPVCLEGGKSVKRKTKKVRRVRIKVRKTKRARQ
jgi:hypothetical protein